MKKSYFPSLLNSTGLHLINTLVNRKLYPIHPIFSESEKHKIDLTLKLYCTKVNHFLRIHETLQDLTVFWNIIMNISYHSACKAEIGQLAEISD